MNHATETRLHAIDERFMSDWIAYGLGELESHLGKHARFADYCARRDEGFRRLDEAIRELSA
jgi:hypothetical protein